MSQQQNNQQIVNVSVNVGAQPTPPSPIIIQRQPHWIVQALWFIFVGWWLGAIIVGLAYLFILLVITMPLGIWLLNRVPGVMALRHPPQVITSGTQSQVPQRPFLLRAIYFLLIGWWFTSFWLTLAYVFCLTIIGMPIGFWMFDRVPAVLTLRKT